MKKVSEELQAHIVLDYLEGYTYQLIMARNGVNRWNIQDALSKFGVETNRIKSPPRLPGGKKKKAQGLLMDRYNDGDFLQPMKVNKNNPVLEDDLDIMERMDNCDDVDDLVEGSYEIVVDEDDEVGYKKND